MILKRIEPLSCAKVYGVICVFIGLLSGVFVAALAWMTKQAFESGAGPDAFSEGLGFVFGTGAILSYPVIYGVLGFVFGFLSAIVYNWVAEHIGGLELDFEE